jgi:hypothetical protein
MRHNSKLSSLSKAIITLDSNSKDLQKYAGIVSLLAAAGKFGLHLATPVITGAIGGKLFESASELAISKTLGLAAAKNGFNYTVFFNAPEYKDSIKSFSLNSVVGVLCKDGQTSGLKDDKNKSIDEVNSESVTIGRSISAKGEPPPLGYKFAPIYGVVAIQLLSGEISYVAASGSVDAAGIFKMQVTDQSIAETEKMFNDGSVERVKRETSTRWHPFGEGIGGAVAEGFGLGGQEIRYTPGLDAKERGKQDVIGGLGEIGSAVGMEAGVGLLGGGVASTLAAPVGAIATGTVGGAAGGIGATIMGTTFGVALPVAAAFSGGYAVGRGIDKYTGIGESIQKWLLSPAAKEGKQYSLKIVAGKWQPYIKDFSIAGVYGELFDSKGKSINPQYNDPVTNQNWVDTASASNARGDKPKDGGIFVPNKIIATIRFKNGYNLNVIASKIIQSGSTTSVEVNEADITAKLAKSISLGKFPPISGVNISEKELEIANKTIQKNITSPLEVKKKDEATVSSTPSGSKSSKDSSWSNYLAKTPNGSYMKSVWDRWSTSLGSSPESYSDFVATWKKLKQLSGLQDMGVRNTSIMIQALGEGIEEDSKNPDPTNTDKNYAKAYSAIQSGDISTVSSLLKNKNS